MIRKRITRKKLKKHVHYDKKTGIFTWKINNHNQTSVGDICDRENNGYIVITIDKTSYQAHRLAWLYVYGYMPKQIDHRDRIRHHNWITNLRIATQSQNCINRPLATNNTSGIKGVMWCKTHNKWLVRITYLRKQIFLGYHKSFDEAVCTRYAGEQCINWEKWDKNSPASQYINKFIGG